jgi:hypothetical protein
MPEGVQQFVMQKSRDRVGYKNFAVLMMGLSCGEDPELPKRPGFLVEKPGLLGVRKS